MSGVEPCAETVQHGSGDFNPGIHSCVDTGSLAHMPSGTAFASVAAPENWTRLMLKELCPRLNT